MMAALQHRSHFIRHQAGALLVLTLTYFVAADIGLRWSLVRGAVSPVYPAAGIAVAGLLLGGVRLWPAVVLGRLMAFWLDDTDQALWLQLAVSFGTAAAAVVAAHGLLYWARIDLALGRLRDVLWLIIWGALVSPAVGATIGTAAVALASGRDSAQALTDWVNWWIGNVTGTLVITPLVLAWARGGPPLRCARERLHLAACVALTSGVAYLVFDTSYSPLIRAWLIFPMLTWAAIAFGVRGATTAMLPVATLAVLGTVSGTGVLSDGGSTEPLRLVMLQQFVAIASISSLILAVVADERRGREALTQSEARFRALIEASSQIVWTTERDGTPHDSPSWRAFTGQSREEWLAGHAFDAIHPEDRERALEEWRRSVAQGTQYEQEYRLRHASGEFRTMAVRAVPLRDGNGEIHEWVGMNVDVTEQRRAQEALADTRSRLENALTVGEIATWVWDIKTDRMYADRNLATMFSVTPEDAAGGPLSKYYPAIHPDDRERVAGLVRKAIESRGGYEADYRLLRPDGTIRWVVARGQVQLDAAGEPYRMHGVVVDITERKRWEEGLRESKERLTFALETAELGEWSLDLQTHDATRSFRHDQIFGYDRLLPEWTYETFLEHVLPEDRARVDVKFKDVFSNKDIWDFECRIRRSDGQVRWIWARGRVWRDEAGNPVRILGTVADITDRKRIEEEREDLLEAERLARAEAERASRLKDEFLATVSHELRTPLNAILGWAQLLDHGNADARTVAEGLSVIARNARVQAELIEDLLDLSRIISGKLRLNIETIMPAEVIEAALAAVRHAAEAKEIRLEKSLDSAAGPLKGDPGRLQQVVWNLLTNAVKFTPRGGMIHVGLQRVDSHIEISVADTGQGIRQEFLPHMFERFRQADGSTTRRHGGLGIGLAIVKQIIELHGGSVYARSAGEGKGTTFVLSLPLAPAALRDETDAAPRPQAALRIPELQDVPLPGIAVLVLDDEADARDLARRILEERGATVTTAATAREALEVFKRERPDVLLSDISMPDHDGYDFIRWVRELPVAEGGQTPAAALTAFARPEDRRRTLLEGYQAHIAKPVNATELVGVVASLAKRAGSSAGEQETASPAAT